MLWSERAGQASVLTVTHCLQYTDGRIGCQFRAGLARSLRGVERGMGMMEGLAKRLVSTTGLAAAAVFGLAILPPENWLETPSPSPHSSNHPSV